MQIHNVQAMHNDISTLSFRDKIGSSRNNFSESCMKEHKKLIYLSSIYAIPQHRFTLTEQYSSRKTESNSKSFGSLSSIWKKKHTMVKKEYRLHMNSCKAGSVNSCCPDFSNQLICPYIPGNPCIFRGFNRWHRKEVPIAIWRVQNIAIDILLLQS